MCGRVSLGGGGLLLEEVQFEEYLLEEYSTHLRNCPVVPLGAQPGGVPVLLMQLVLELVLVLERPLELLPSLPATVGRSRCGTKGMMLKVSYFR